MSPNRPVKGLIEALAGVYEKSTTSNRLFLLKKRVYLMMPKGKSIVNHLNNFISFFWGESTYIGIIFEERFPKLIPN